MGDPTCFWCGTPLAPRKYRGGRPKKYCNGACRQKALRRDKPEMMDAIAARTAAKAARAKAERRSACIVCGGPRKSAAGAACSKRDCTLEMKRRVQRRRYYEDIEKARGRVAAIRASWSPERRAAENQKTSVRNKAAGYTAAKSAGDQKRRALKRGVLVERVERLAIFKRDRWKCGICGKRIDSSLRFPDPGSPTIDHIVPLSLGGPHTAANLRAAHMECNRQRSDAKGETLQLALI